MQIDNPAQIINIVSVGLHGIQLYQAVDGWYTRAFDPPHSEWYGPFDNERAAVEQEITRQGEQAGAYDLSHFGPPQAFRHN